MVATHKIKQRDIVWADFEPVVGREQGGKRPAVIISGETLNAIGNMAIVCPLSASVKYFANCPIIKKNSSNKLTHDSEVLVFQIKASSQTRFREKIGEITEEELEMIIQGVNNYLTY